jgi:hypothetical protein
MSEEQWRRVEAVIPKQKSGPEARQRHEMMMADELLHHAPGKAFIADAG